MFAMSQRYIIQDYKRIMDKKLASNILLAILITSVFIFVWSFIYRFFIGARITSLITEFKPLVLLDGFNEQEIFNITSPFWKSFGISFILTFVLAACMLLYRKVNYFGDARWAYSGEVRNANMLEEKGVIFGKYKGNYLRTDEALHFLLAAPTRSGKGVGFVIPNLLSWPDSVVVLDVKHENYQLTAGFRKEHGQSVYKYSPFDADSRSHCFNPLEEIRTGEQRITDIQKLAVILIPTEKKGDMWANEARDLFVGLVLLVFDVDEFDKNIGQIYRILKTEMDFSEYIEEILLDDTITLDNNCHMSLSSYKNKASKERSGVRSTLVSALNLWSNPVLDAATSKSDFSFKSLRQKRTSIYFGCKVNQLNTLAPLINLFFQQCIDSLSETLPENNEPYKVLLLIDEFAQLGKMESIVNGLAVLAGYNIRIALIVQGLGQMKALYMHDLDSLLQNTAIQIYFAGNDEITSKSVSSRLGKKTIRTRSRSSQGGYDTRGGSISTTSQARDLLLPEEFSRLPSTQQIVLKEHTRPVLANKIRYFKNNEFKKRLLPEPEVPHLDLKVHSLVTSRNPEARLNQDSRIESEITALLEEE